MHYYKKVLIFYSMIAIRFYLLDLRTDVGLDGGPPLGGTILKSTAIDEVR